MAFRAIGSSMNPGHSDNAHPQSVTTAQDDEFSELVEFSIARWKFGSPVSEKYRDLAKAVRTRHNPAEMGSPLRHIN